MDNPQPTNSQILEAVNTLGGKFDVLTRKVDTFGGQFDVLTKEVSSLTKKVDGMEASINDLIESVTFIKDNAVTKDEFNVLDGRVSRIEANMATKDDLSRVVGNLRGDMVALVRKEDNKVNAIVDALEEERALPVHRIKAIRLHHVFPAPPVVSPSSTRHIF